ncbi:MAG TPA: patatin-like phospholipase family protein [Xanthobacteraceae bacterium]|jgi:NTE family protein
MINDNGAGHRSRALVLGGGGPVGRAWEIGLVDGFAGQGIDLGTANLIIGTSAGAVVGAQLALKLGFGAPPKIDGPPPGFSGSMVDLATAMARAAQSPEAELIRTEIGRMALSAETISEDASVSRFAPFAGQAWPNQFRATTVNARTGQLKIWDASSGAPLDRAMAASTAVPCIWPPITINGERYIDGGVRSMLNADLAIGSHIVIAVSCLPLTARDNAGPAFLKAMNAAPLAELDAVRGSGATLAVIEPGSEFVVLTKHGTAMMDSNLVPEAYRLGQITAVAEAESVRRVWNSH